LEGYHPENCADIGFRERRRSLKNEFFQEKEKIIESLSIRPETEIRLAGKYVREFLWFPKRPLPLIQTPTSFS